MMYKTYAKYYDQFYERKNYENETHFLHELLSKHHVHTILDVGCGTGTHLSKLELLNYTCEGIDLNHEMIEIAKMKLRGNVTQADMTHFNLNKQFDAVISMFAVFNHNITLKDASKTLHQLKNT